MHGVSGLEGVVVAQTRLSRVEGDVGRLTLAGYAVEAVAPAVPFEAMAHLLWHDRLPSDDELEELTARLAVQRALDPATLALLDRAAHNEVSPIDALRMGAASLSLGAVTEMRIVAALPTIVAAYERLRHGLAPIAPDPSLRAAVDFLRMCTGELPTEAQAHALDTYLNTIVDHGFNASTFTARVIASTRADLGAAVEGALGALKGPLHGGAPGPALQAFLELRGRHGDLATNTRTWVKERVANHDRIMGFGHRVYRTRDPRADVLGAAAKELLAGSGLYEDALVHERAVLETLHNLKPGRTIATNVEFYTALLLHGLGFDPAVFTCIFAMGRTAGWIAHYGEQQAEGRLIRPRAIYSGAEGRSL